MQPALLSGFNTFQFPQKGACSPFWCSSSQPIRKGGPNLKQVQSAETLALLLSLSPLTPTSNHAALLTIPRSLYQCLNSGSWAPEHLLSSNRPLPTPPGIAWLIHWGNSLQFTTALSLAKALRSLPVIKHLKLCPISLWPRGSFNLIKGFGPSLQAPISGDTLGINCYVKKHQLSASKYRSSG